VNRRGWALFVVASVLGGMPYLLIKIAVEDFPPLTIVWLRCTIAAVVLLPFMLRRTTITQLKEHWRPAVLLSLAQISGPFTLIAMGEQHITSSMAGLLIALEPLVVALLVMRFDRTEPVNARLMAGLISGVTGVVVLVGFTMGGDRLAWLGAGMVLLATIGYSIGILLVKWRLSQVSPIGLSAATLGFNAVLLAPAGAVGLLTATPTLNSSLSIVVLGVACTAVAFVAYYALIVVAGAGRASVVTYLNPAVAVVLGALFLSEPMTSSMIAGLVLVLVGSWLATGPSTPPPEIPIDSEMVDASESRPPDS